MIFWPVMGKKFNTHTFACVHAKLKEIVYLILPFQIYYHLFHCLHGFDVVNRCQYCTRFNVQSVPLSKFLGRKFTFKLDFFRKEFTDNFLADDIYLNFHYTGVVCNNHGTIGK